MRILIAVLLLFSNLLPGQTDKKLHLFSDWSPDFRPGPRIAFSWQKKPSIEFGVHVIVYSSPPPEGDMYDLRSDQGFHPDGWWNIGAGAEFPFGAGHFIVGPKLFTELNIGVLSMALNTTFFISDGKCDPRITPEIGLGLLGFFGVRYGYNWAPAGPVFETIGMHRLTIFLLLVKPRHHNMLTSL